MTGTGVQEKVVVRRRALAEPMIIAGQCWHCRGLMVRGQSAYLDFEGGRCIQCGEIFDHLLNPYRHQRARSQPQPRYYGR